MLTANKKHLLSIQNKKQILFGMNRRRWDPVIGIMMPIALFVSKFCYFILVILFVETSGRGKGLVIYCLTLNHNFFIIEGKDIQGFAFGAFFLYFHERAIKFQNIGDVIGALGATESIEWLLIQHINLARLF